MSTSIYLREERTFSLFGRDACSDAFGPNAMNSICAPSNTLCCVRRNQAFPSCQQYLGRGWCCVGEKDSDNCYVDGPSACDEPNAVPCTNLASGVDKACCPRLTSCHNDYKASLTQVRCNIRQIDLKNAARAETQSTSTTSTTSSTSTTSTTSTENVGPTGTPTISGTSANAASTSSPPSPPTEKGGVSGGVIAGAVVGPTFVLIALVLLGCFFWRRKKAKNANISSGGSYGTPNDAAPAPGMQQWVAQQQQYQQHYQQHPGPHGPTSAQSPLPPNYSTAPSYSDVAKPYPLSHSPPVSVGPDPYATAWNGPVEVDARPHQQAAELPSR